MPSYVNDKPVLVFKLICGTHRIMTRHMRMYQKMLRSSSKKRGAKTWYFIHHVSQTPLLGVKNLV